MVWCHRASAICVNHSITLFEQERLSLITQLAWRLEVKRRQGELPTRLCNQGECEEWQKTCDRKRPWRTLSVEVRKDQVGGNFAIPHIAPTSSVGSQEQVVWKNDKSNVWRLLKQAGSGVCACHRTTNQTEDPPSRQLFCILHLCQVVLCVNSHVYVEFAAFIILLPPLHSTSLNTSLMCNEWQDRKGGCVWAIWVVTVPLI